MKLFIGVLVLLGLTPGIHAMSKKALKDNPVYTEWSGPYQGVPPFDKIETSDFKAALIGQYEEAKKEYNKIANQKEEPTFENTMVPIEKVFKDTERVGLLFSIWSSNISDKKVQEVEKEMAPISASFEDEVFHNGPLYKRIEALYNSKGFKKLNSEKQRLVWTYKTEFEKKGAALDPGQKKQVAEINKKLATLTTEFTQNLLNDENDDYLLISDQKDVEDLPKWLQTAAKNEAEKRKLNGWAISNTRSSMQPFLIYSPNRELRKKAFKIWTSRGDNGGKNDNNKIISEILELRAKRSKIMGFKSYAHWQLSDKMAKTPDRAMDLMMRVWEPAKKQVALDVKAMEKIVKKEEKKPFKIKPWDYRYYAEKLRKDRYDFDMDKLKPYLELSKIQKAMFWMADKLYSFQFKKIDNVPVYHPDVTAYEVTKNGKTVGLWYFDPYARTGKRSGAWMNAYRVQDRLSEDTMPIVSNNSNFVKANEGELTLISWDDAETMFHEFGHALHGLSSNVTYPSLAGTNTARDFVEFPSQIHEDWLSTPEVLKFLTNASGEPIPKKLIKKMKKASTFNEGFGTVEYLASALLDMKLHLLEDPKVDPKKFEEKTLKKLGMPSQVVMRHRLPQFAHVFSGEGYSAGYYSYLWSDVLRQDAFKAFLEAKGPYDSKVAKKFQENILSVGNTIDPAEAYRNFRGRDPKVRALLESKGFKKL